MYTNEINIKVLTTVSPGEPKSNSQLNVWEKRTREGAPNIGPTWDPQSSIHSYKFLYLLEDYLFNLEENWPVTDSSECSFPIETQSQKLSIHLTEGRSEHYGQLNFDYKYQEFYTENTR